MRTSSLHSLSRRMSISADSGVPGLFTPITCAHERHSSLYILAAVFILDGHCSTAAEFCPLIGSLQT